jgi:replicative DNA helicase
MTHDPPDSPGEFSPAPDSPDRPFDAAAWLGDVLAAGGTGDAVATGFPSLDTLLGGGPRRGDLVVVGGDVGSGKSALALAMALRCSDSEGDAALFSGELSSTRLLERALCIEGRVRVDDVRHARLDEAQHASVAAAALRLRTRAPMLAHLPPNGFAGLSDLLIEHLGLDLLVIDPLQSLARGEGSTEEALAQAVRDLKGLAVRRECVVLLVSHLDQGVRSRPDPRPRLEDFGALGAIRQLADIVLGVYREEMYDASRDVDGAVEVHVLKHRDGAAGYADLYFYKQWLRFEDMVEPDR